METSVRWGIVGTGMIAHDFAKGLESVPGARLVAVASRRRETADTFADRYQVCHRHVGAAELAQNPAVDAVFIGTPHNCHRDDTLAALAAGKAVLCEKPFCINAREADEMISLARAKRCFLMEAMWPRFLPAMARVREIVSAGELGEITLVQAGFFFRADWNAEGRLFNPALGGGALLDLGVYPISLAQMVFGRDPVRISGVAQIGTTGVDEQASIVLDYGREAMATLACSLRSPSPSVAVISGTTGYVRIPNPFIRPDRLYIKRPRQREVEELFPVEGNGYNYEAAAVMESLGRGELESPIMTWDMSSRIMRIMDQARAQWGGVYPADQIQPGVREREG